MEIDHPWETCPFRTLLLVVQDMLALKYGLQLDETDFVTKAKASGGSKAAQWLHMLRSLRDFGAPKVARCTNKTRDPKRIARADLLADVGALADGKLGSL